MKTNTTSVGVKRAKEMIIDDLLVSEDEAHMQVFHIDASTLPLALQRRIRPDESALIQVSFPRDEDRVHVRAPCGLLPLLDQIAQRRLVEALGFDLLSLASHTQFQSSSPAAKPTTRITEEPSLVFKRIRRDFDQLVFCCPICRRQHEAAAVSIIPCHREECQVEFAELGHGKDVVVEIRRHPEVVDLLLSLTAWAANVSGRPNALPFTLPMITPITMSTPAVAYKDHTKPAPDKTGIHAPIRQGVRIPIPIAATPTAPRDIRDLFFNPFPSRFIFNDVRQYQGLREALNRIPPIEVMRDLVDSGMLHSYFSHDAYMQEAFHLLNWVINSNRTTLEYIPPDKRTDTEVILASGLHIFRVVNPPEKEAAFTALLTKDSTTEWLYHGSPAGNWHSIVRNSLKNCSGTEMMLRGASQGPGIYFGVKGSTAIAYSLPAVAGWEQSALDGNFALLVAERVMSTREGKESAPALESLHRFYSPARVVSDSATVVNRYLLIGNSRLKSAFRDPI